MKKVLRSRIYGMWIVFLLFLVFQTTAIDFGDVNNDQVVDIVDALVVAQASTGYFPVGFRDNPSDVNLDKDINIVDALMIAQKYVGILSMFPGEVKYMEYEKMLREAEANWLRYSNYTVNQRVICFCQYSGISYGLEVLNGTIQPVTDPSTGEVLPPRQFNTIEELFEEIHTALDRKYHIENLQFDSEYFYPTDLTLDPIIMAVDDEISFRLDSFIPARSIQPAVYNPGLELISTGIELMEAWVSGDVLNLTLAFSGCSGDHRIIVFSDITFMESEPPQLDCFIYDANHGELCDAYFVVDRSFSLIPVAELYREQYQSGGTVILNLRDASSGDEASVGYTFE